MMIGHLAAVVGLAAAVPESQSADTPSLTLGEIKTMDARRLGPRVFGMLGERFHELRLTQSKSTEDGINIQFATLPRSAGWPGLCEADIYSVDFDRLDPEATTALRSDAPLRPGAFSVEKVFKLIGDTKAIRWTDDETRKLEASCRRAGPVLEQEDTLPQLRFFTGYAQARRGMDSFNAGDAYLAARTLQLATDQARQGSLPIASCRDEDLPQMKYCDKPEDFIANLPLGSFTHFEIEPCNESAAELCVTAHFVQPGTDFRDGQRIAVTFDTTATWKKLHGGGWKVLAASLRSFHVELD